MQADGLPELAIRTFRHYFEQLAGGGTGLLTEADIRPVESVPDLESLPRSDAPQSDALRRCVMIKLNGGLGTSMGLDQAKSLLPARENLSFLDLIARQVLHLRSASGHAVPLLLMNSFATDRDSLAALERFPELLAGQRPLPPSFLQHRVPRLDPETLAPIAWPDAPQREWCPPGHGDLYTALAATGLLRQLLAQGFRYAFVSNADNLGATLDPAILDWMARERIPFVMEVTDRTPADRKGGHLALDGDGRLRLRESAQCPADERDRFQDIERYRYFNTNNLWLDLQALSTELERREGVLGLPMIRNLKHVVPEDASTPRAVQVETAMGSALEIFPDARILRVPRSRFAPVKTTSDLLVLWSDRYRLDPSGQLYPVCENALRVDLDPAFYATVDAFRQRFAHGAPSLAAAESVSIRGDIRFEGGVVLRGDVRLVNDGPAARIIAAGSVIDGRQESSRLQTGEIRSV
ncbi:UTP--glucose-1-phosphate uridylyltransferase [Wenzhouxiangella sp. C33]|uniref:UTP--glucose-1-phosphate uridylyltransferase n=2 Tax=Wenzhouxiangella limi TaxID=2707351 RepID=A0A845V186_9GAMM|nr:UTP--glucose-1-phosphate uridylyltransferase [Wenzhouxiangella limi]